MGVYERLGVRQVINADATLTRLGGSLMPSQVLDAMREAASSFVDMYELQQVVGKRLAELTRNEAAYVSTGAAAGLVLATLAAMTDGDLPTIARLIETGEAPKNEVIIHRGAPHPVRSGDPARRRTHRRGRQSPADVSLGARGGDHPAHGDGFLRRGRSSRERRAAVGGDGRDRSRPRRPGGRRRRCATAADGESLAVHAGARCGSRGLLRREGLPWATGQRVCSSAPKR